jgi:hypothetical protein
MKNKTFTINKLTGELTTYTLVMEELYLFRNKMLVRKYTPVLEDLTETDRKYVWAVNIQDDTQVIIADETDLVKVDPEVAEVLFKQPNKPQDEF